MCNERDSGLAQCVTICNTLDREKRAKLGAKDPTHSSLLKCFKLGGKKSMGDNCVTLMWRAIDTVVFLGSV